MTANQTMHQWHLDIATRISNSNTWGIIPVVTEFPAVRSIGNTFQQQVRKLTDLICGINHITSGMAVFVRFPHTTGASTKLGSINMNMVAEVSVVESKIYNSNATSGFAPSGIGIHADDAAIGIARLLENWRDFGVADAARVQDIISGQEGWIPPDLRDGSEKFDLYVTAFQVKANATWSLPTRCAAPLITMNGNLAVMTSTTDGVMILYTLDGTHPMTTSLPAYNGAIAVTSGTVIRAIAQLADTDDSDTTYFVVP